MGVLCYCVGHLFGCPLLQRNVWPSYLDELLPLISVPYHPLYSLFTKIPPGRGYLTQISHIQITRVQHIPTLQNSLRYQSRSPIAYARPRLKDCVVPNGIFSISAIGSLKPGIWALIWPYALANVARVAHAFGCPSPGWMGVRSQLNVSFAREVSKPGPRHNWKPSCCEWII